MNDAIELFSAFGNVACALVCVLAAAVAWSVSRRVASPSRTARVAAPLAAAATSLLALVASAQEALHGLGAPSLCVERADANAVVWGRVWSDVQRRRVVRASLSPLHRGAVKRIFDQPRRSTGAFPPADDGEIAGLRGWLRGRGECALEARLDRMLGAFERAASTPCAGAPAAREAAEAAFAMGDVGRAWSVLALHRAELHDGFDGRLLTLDDAPPLDALATLPAVPAHERPLWACVLERVRQRRLGDADVAVWAPMLTSPLAACRILAATAPSRRDAEALRALVRLPVPALRQWRAALAVSRALLAVSGKVETPQCLSRRIAAPDADWLARNPAVADTLRREASDEGCAYVMDRVWFPATRALAWHDAMAPEQPSMDAFEDLIVAWQLVDGAWERMHTVLDARYTRTRRARFERDFRASLGPIAAWAVGRLDEAWADGRAWPRGFSWPSVLAPLDELPRREGWGWEGMLRAHDIPHYAIASAKRWELDVVRIPAHNPVLDAWIDAWRTGTFAPAHDAPAWLRDTTMLAVARAATDADVAGVLRALGPPSMASAERLAAVAYRVHGDASRFEPWLRRAWATLDPVTMPLAAWEDALHTLRTCALRLRLPALREVLTGTQARVHAMRRRDDGFVAAVLEGPRPTPPPDDDDDE